MINNQYKSTVFHREAGYLPLK